MVGLEQRLRSRRQELLNSIQGQREGLVAGERNADQLDQVAAESNREDAGRNIRRAREMVFEIDDALERMKAGEYGICADCEEQIPAKRLAACLTATRCVPCQEAYEHAQKVAA
jgi:DnaK suppressor protein